MLSYLMFPTYKSVASIKTNQYQNGIFEEIVLCIELLENKDHTFEICFISIKMILQKVSTIKLES